MPCVCRIAAAACFLASRPGGPPGREAGQRHAPGRVVQRAEAQLRVGLVVAAQDGGTGFGSLDVLEGRGHRGEVWVAEGQPLPGRRASPAGQGRLGDDGERPLRADEESSQVRAGRRARDRPAAQDLAVRQDRGEPEQHVLDRAEPGGGLPGGRRGDPAADGGDRDRLRVVAGGQPELGQFLLPAGRRAPRPVPRPSGIPGRRGRCGPSGTGRGRRRSLSAVAPPQTPEPAPLGMTAVPVSLAQARMVATSPVVAGEMTAAGSGRSSPRTRRSSASGQESVALWRSVCGSVLIVPSGRRLASISRELTSRIVDRRRLPGLGIGPRPRVGHDPLPARGLRMNAAPACHSHTADPACSLSTRPDSMVGPLYRIYWCRSGRPHGFQDHEDIRGSMHAGGRQRVADCGQTPVPWRLSRSVTDSVGPAGALSLPNIFCRSIRVRRGRSGTEAPVLAPSPLRCIASCRALARSHVGEPDRSLAVRTAGQTR